MRVVIGYFLLVLERKHMTNFLEILNILFTKFDTKKVSVLEDIIGYISSLL